MPWKRGLATEKRGDTSDARRSGEPRPAGSGSGRSGSDDRLTEQVVDRVNVERALARVRSNRGSPGVDGMTVDELPTYLVLHWDELRAALLAGSYQPQPVKRQTIPKPGGGVRELGIPTVVDRLIQQAILQVLGPQIDPTFSTHSYGFRPGRSAHQAVLAAQRYVQEGRPWVVDVDLERFFDRVNHDVLMGRLAKRIADRRMLGLLRRFLEAGILASGVVLDRHEGTPQGGPLSPLLANLLLDEVDRALERRGHAFVRYADDCNVYVSSQRAGERVMNLLRRLYDRLRLRINEAKSAVARAVTRGFLGYGIWQTKGEIKRRVAPKAVTAFRAKVRELTNRNRGASLARVVEELTAFTQGWKQYFRLGESRTQFDALDGWILRRLRMLLLKQWKRGRTAYDRLRKLGLPGNDAGHLARWIRGWWRTANHPLMKIATPRAHFAALGWRPLAPTSTS